VGTLRDTTHRRKYLEPIPHVHENIGSLYRRHAIFPAAGEDAYAIIVNELWQIRVPFLVVMLGNCRGQPATTVHQKLTGANTVLVFYYAQIRPIFALVEHSVASDAVAHRLIRCVFLDIGVCDSGVAEDP
jgi:hypothetical protein